MNKRGNQAVIAAIIIIVLLALALGIIKNPFQMGKPNIKVNSGYAYNISYGSGNGATISLTLSNPQSEVRELDLVVVYDTQVLQINQLSQQVNFGMIIPQSLFAGDKRNIEMGVAQIDRYATGQKELSIYLCERNQCLNENQLSNAISEEKVIVNVGTR